MTYSLRLIRTAVRRVRDDPPATVERLGGSNHTYRVTFADGDRVVVKVGSRAPSQFLAAPATIRLVGRETSVPVPSVLATGEEPLGTPYAVYDYVEGDTTAVLADLPVAAHERLCREAGANLAALHDLTVPGFGRLDPSEGAFAVPDPIAYDDLLGRSLDRQLRLLGETRFADLRPAIDATASAAIDSLDFGGVTPAVVHGDYRLANLSVDTDARPVTRAVLDWEGATAGDPLWDLAMTLALLVDGAGVPQSRRRRLRRALLDEYGSVDAEGERWSLYRLLARVRLARHLEEETAGRSRAATDRRAHEHRERLRELTAEAGEP